MHKDTPEQQSSANKTVTDKSRSTFHLVFHNVDLIIVLLVSFGLLLASAVTSTFMGYPLLLSLLLLIAALRRRGFALPSLLKMAMSGARQALPVVNILLLIGIITAVWMASGTVPALVYYGTRWIAPQFFVLWAFLLTSIVSTLTGTSFGSVGTIGVALIVLAKSSGVALNPVAGAIMAGAFVGDRCSPMSSSAHLVASVTRTSLYANLRHMLASSLWPFSLSVLFYFILSFSHPAQAIQSSIVSELPELFELSFGTLLPAIAILLLAVLRVNVKLAMLVSIGLGIAIAHTQQGYPLLSIIQYSVFGYQLQQSSPLQSILVGGGLLPMAKATVVVFISTAFAGIFSGSGTLAFIDQWIISFCSTTSDQQTRKRSIATVCVSIIANLFGCTQTIAILLTQQIMQPHFTHQEKQLALALEDSAVVIAPLIPWNIAGLIPATVLTVGVGFIPYAVYLFLLPLFLIIQKEQHPLPASLSAERL